MIGILTGFAVIALAVVVGYVVGRTGILGPHARHVLSRLAFSVLTPFLLFSVLSTADVAMLFSALLPVSAIAAVLMMAVFALVAAIAWRRGLARTTIGALAAGYVNGNNFGIPVALYMLGNAAYSAPVVLVQLIVFAPVAIATLDARVNGRTSVLAILRATYSNPILIGSLLGLLVSIARIELPPIVLDPIELIGHAAVPVILISYGISLAGQRVLEPGSGRREVVLASLLKLIVMPVVAWAIGAFVFRLDPMSLYAVTVLAALPTAQNVFTYAQRYDAAELVARDTILITTIGCAPVLVVISLLLGT